LAACVASQKAGAEHSPLSCVKSS